MVAIGATIDSAARNLSMFKTTYTSIISGSLELSAVYERDFRSFCSGLLSLVIF